MIYFQSPKKLLLFLCAFLFVLNLDPLCANSEILNFIKNSKYIFCVDGGASKTEIRVLNHQGDDLMLYRKNMAPGSQSLILGPSNISVLGQEGVKKNLQEMVCELSVGNEKTFVKDIINESCLIGGFAGAGRQEGQEELKSIFESMGFQKNKIFIESDAGLACMLAKDQEGILIAGTGSICFLKNKNTIARFGGLGYRLNDEGSGYVMGLSAIRSALQNEYANCELSALSKDVKELFAVKELKELIAPINQNQIPPSTIGLLAKNVFERAHQGDLQAISIQKKAAHELGELLKTGVESLNLHKPHIYLIGGLFKSKHAPFFIEQIMESPSLISCATKPILINLSHAMIAKLLVKEALLSQDPLYTSLSQFPICDKDCPKDFKEKFQLAANSTEKEDQRARNLSLIFEKNCTEGLEMLHLLDHSVLSGTEAFVENHLAHLSHAFLRTLKKGGRIIFMGSGSSGRVALILSAKWRRFFQQKNQYLPFKLKDSVLGVIAGGPACFLKCHENYSDSFSQGYDSLKKVQTSSKDLIVLISPSATDQFSVGAIKAAEKIGATSYYLYNSKTVPKNVETLFKKRTTNPLLVDIGPQSIIGCTRLQASGLSELCLGAALECTLQQLHSKKPIDDKKIGYKLITNLQDAWNHVSDKLPQITELVNLSTATLKDPKADFWSCNSSSKCGFITFLSSSNSLGEIILDTAAAPPNFSMNPPRRNLEKEVRKRAEFRAYLSGEKSNFEAWKDLVGTSFTLAEKKEIQNLLLSTASFGCGSFHERVENPENLLVCVCKTSQPQEEIIELTHEVEKVKKNGVKIASLIIEDHKFSQDPSIDRLIAHSDATIRIPISCCEYLGVTSCLAIKQTLNLMTNATMFKMNKIYGNFMVDLSASSHKLIDRSIRTIQNIYSQLHPGEKPFDYSFLFHFVVRAHQYKRLSEKYYHKYIPSCVKLILTMLEKKCSLDEALDFLQKHQENLHALFTF